VPCDDQVAPAVTGLLFAVEPPGSGSLIEGYVRLTGGALTGDALLLGLVPDLGVGGRRSVHVAVGPEDVAFNAVLAAVPAEALYDVVRGGEVTSKAGKVARPRQAAAGARRPRPSATSGIPQREPAKSPRSRQALAR
jgi:hypothetical protein